jgi:DNA-binding MarR family transcriptional regulator
MTVSVNPGSADLTPSDRVEDAAVRRFLRCSHILGSALRELLEERFLRQVSPIAVSRSQFCFLKLITLNPDLQVGEMARRLGISPAATSKAIDRLEECGLVSRGASPDDRRATLVSASPSGRTLVSDYEALKAATVAPVVGELGRDGLEQLCGLLERVNQGLLRDEVTPPATCLRCAGYHAADCAIAHDRSQCGFRPRSQERTASTEVPT